MLAASNPTTQMKRIATLVLSALAIFAAPSTRAQDQSFILIARGNQLPANLDAAVTAAGGRVTQVLPQIGIAVAESSIAGFAASAAQALGISVLPDVAWETSLPMHVGDVEVADVEPQPESHTVVPTDSFHLRYCICGGYWRQRHQHEPRRPTAASWISIKQWHTDQPGG
ncbi:MAG: hypothetical protein Q7S40_19380 [Opitutaceae bacterium]|nr:hypothetical protein [Opitutaceae bacterium]